MTVNEINETAEKQKNTIASGLTKHVVMFVTSKQERGIVVKSFLEKNDYRFIGCLSMYDALQSAAKEMPHVIISESQLADGSVIDLYDKLQKELPKIPIIVHVLRKSDAEAIAKRKFSGFLLGAIEPLSLLAKIRGTLANNNHMSPFFVPVEATKLNPHIGITFESLAVGQLNDMVILRSSVELDSRTNHICTPVDKKYDPATLRFVTNLTNQNSIYNLCPFNRVTGSGKAWMYDLPKFFTQEKLGQKLLFVDPDKNRFDQYEPILASESIMAVYVPSLDEAMDQMAQENYSGIYLHELTSDAASANWKFMYDNMPLDNRPGVVIATKQNPISQHQVSYIKQPFGMGRFLEMLKASFETPGEIDTKLAQSSFFGVSLRFQNSAKLLGLDETGGILEVGFPMLKGTKLQLEHDFLIEFLGIESVVTVSAIAQKPDLSENWQVRFERVEKDISKSKYWQKLTKALTG